MDLLGIHNRAFREVERSSTSNFNGSTKSICRRDGKLKDTARLHLPFIVKTIAVEFQIG